MTPTEAIAAIKASTEHSNRVRFELILTEHYRVLFTRLDYALAAKKYTPAALAEKFTAGLLDGTAGNDGDGVKRTCKDLGIKPTFKAIRAYLEG